MADTFNLNDLEGLAYEAKQTASALEQEIAGGGAVDLCETLSSSLVDQAIFLSDVFEALSNVAKLNPPKGA